MKQISSKVDINYCKNNKLPLFYELLLRKASQILRICLKYSFVSLASKTDLVLLISWRGGGLPLNSHFVCLTIKLSPLGRLRLSNIRPTTRVKSNNTTQHNTTSEAWCIRDSDFCHLCHLCHFWQLLKWAVFWGYWSSVASTSLIPGRSRRWGSTIISFKWPPGKCLYLHVWWLHWEVVVDTGQRNY